MHVCVLVCIYIYYILCYLKAVLFNYFDYHEMVSIIYILQISKLKLIDEIVSQN